MKIWLAHTNEFLTDAGLIQKWYSQIQEQSAEVSATNLWSSQILMPEKMMFSTVIIVTILQIQTMQFQIFRRRLLMAKTSLQKQKLLIPRILIPLKN